MKEVSPMINGQTRKKQSIVICFPKVNTKDMINTFKELFRQKYLEAVDKEQELYKIQKLSELHNMAVQYYSNFMLYKNAELSAIPVSYANLNANGLTYNKKN